MIILGLIIGALAGVYRVYQYDAYPDFFNYFLAFLIFGAYGAFGGLLLSLPSYVIYGRNITVLNDFYSGLVIVLVVLLWVVFRGASALRNYSKRNDQDFED